MLLWVVTQRFFLGVNRCVTLLQPSIHVLPLESTRNAVLFKSILILHWPSSSRILFLGKMNDWGCLDIVNYWEPPQRTLLPLPPSHNCMFAHTARTKIIVPHGSININSKWAVQTNYLFHPGVFSLTAKIRKQKLLPALHMQQEPYLWNKFVFTLVPAVHCRRFHLVTLLVVLIYKEFPWGSQEKKFPFW